MGVFDDIQDIAEYLPGMRNPVTAGRAIHGMATGDAEERDNSLAILESASGELGLVPGLGTLINAGQTAYHTGAAAYDGITGDRNGAVAHGTQALWSGIGTFAPLPVGVLDAAASEVATEARVATAHDGRDASEVPGGIGDLLAEAAVGATDMVFGADDSNWIAPGDVPTGTRGGEISAGMAALGAMTGAGPLGGALGWALGDDLGELLGADTDAQSDTAARSTQMTRNGQMRDRQEAFAERRAERRARNERLNRESAAADPAPRVPVQIDPVRGGRSEADISILASRAGVPMEQLQQLGPDGRFIQNEAAIRRAEESVFGAPDAAPAPAGDTAAAPAADAAPAAARRPRRRRPRRRASDDSAGGFLTPSGRWVSDNDPDAARLRRRYRR